MLAMTRRGPWASRSVMELFDSLTSESMLNASCTAGTLPLDLSEADGEFVIRASLPGFKRDDIDVQIHDGVLSISAKRADECETNGEKYYRRERRYGSVRRRISLPNAVTASNAVASLDDGVLTLRLPLARKPGRSRSR